MKDRVWEEISLKNLDANIDLIKSFAPNKTLILLMKDNAYGHGAAHIAKRLQYDKSICGYAVASIGEALHLRVAGVTKNIIIISHTFSERYKDVILNNIIQTVSSFEDAKNLSDIAVFLEENVRVEIALDTGMNRIGFQLGSKELFNNALTEIEKISKLPNLTIHGFFSHFSVCDEDLENDNDNNEFTKNQEKLFEDFLSEINKLGIQYRYSSLSNSAGILNKKGAVATSVRPGIILYGISPSKHLRQFDLKPVMTLKSRIMYIKNIEQNETISYGRTYKSNNKMKIATIACGYGDGYPRTASNKASVIINDTLCPIVGRVTMDMFMVDVTNVDCKLYDEVILIGKSETKEITLDDFCELTNEFNYEILTRINHRVEKIYVE